MCSKTRAGRRSATPALVDVVRFNGVGYENLFEEGESDLYRAQRRQRSSPKRHWPSTARPRWPITCSSWTRRPASRVSAPGDPDPIPDSINSIPGESGTLTAGATITAGRAAAHRLQQRNRQRASTSPRRRSRWRPADGTITTPNLGFTQHAGGGGPKRHIRLHRLRHAGRPAQRAADNRAGITRRTDLDLPLVCRFGRQRSGGRRPCDRRGDRA